MTEKKTLGIVFSNMHDSKLNELTQYRTLGSVPFCGRYRLVDFPLSNLANCGVTEVGLITKSNYQSLMDHVGSGKAWDMARRRDGLFILPPFSQAEEGPSVYRGRLEALENIIGFIKKSTARYVVITDCDTVCNFDLEAMIDYHVSKNADITLAYRRQAFDGAANDAVLFQLDDFKRVSDVIIGGTVTGCYAESLNILVMERARLISLIEHFTGKNLFSFERDVLQSHYKELRLFGYEMPELCFRITNIRDYYQANMACLRPDVRRAIFSPERTVLTKVRDEVPAKYGLNAAVKNSLIADGCVIEGEVTNCVLSRGVRVGKGAKLHDCIIMQDSVIGEDCSLGYVITDKNVTLSSGRVLMGFESYPLFIKKDSVV